MIIDILVVCCQSSWCGQTYIDVAKHTLNRPFRVDRFVKIHSIVIIRYDCWYFKDHSVQSWLAMVPPLVGCLALCCGSPRATRRWDEILVRNLCISDIWTFIIKGVSMSPDVNLSSLRCLLMYFIQFCLPPRTKSVRWTRVWEWPMLLGFHWNHFPTTHGGTAGIATSGWSVHAQLTQLSQIVSPSTVNVSLQPTQGGEDPKAESYEYELTAPYPIGLVGPSATAASSTDGLIELEVEVEEEEEPSPPLPPPLDPPPLDPPPPPPPPPDRSRSPVPRPVRCPLPWRRRSDSWQDQISWTCTSMQIRHIHNPVANLASGTFSICHPVLWRAWDAPCLGLGTHQIKFDLDPTKS